MCGQQKPSNYPRSNQHNPVRQLLGTANSQTAPAATSTGPSTPTMGLRGRGNNASRSTGRSSRQNAATRRTMRREERVTVQGPVKKQQPNRMSHRGQKGSKSGGHSGYWWLESGFSSRRAVAKRLEGNRGWGATYSHPRRGAGAGHGSVANFSYTGGREGGREEGWVRGQKKFVYSNSTSNFGNL